MDKPGPRDQAKRLPLIIDRPDLAHPFRRVLAVFFTTLAWGLWVSMWIPFIAAMAHHFGYGHWSPIAQPSQISLSSFLALVNVSPYIAATAILIVLAGFIYEKIKAASNHLVQHGSEVGILSLANGADLNPKLLDQWQSARILYVQHGDMGRVSNASEAPPGEMGSK